MSKFKVGDNIIRINDAVYGQRAGFKAIVDANYCYESSNSVRCKIIDENWELSKPKWTIYNNTLHWSQLSDKQKGKLLVAENDGHEIKGLNCTALNKPVRFNCHHITYFAVEAVPVKPEPTMAELFIADWHEANVHLVKEFSEYMIAKGWVKK
jgi:hypothetical protein